MKREDTGVRNLIGLFEEAGYKLVDTKESKKIGIVVEGGLVQDVVGIPESDWFVIDFDTADSMTAEEIDEALKLLGTTFFDVTGVNVKEPSVADWPTVNAAWRRWANACERAIAYLRKEML